MTGPNVEHVATHTIWLHSLAANQDTSDQLPGKSNDLKIKEGGARTSKETRRKGIRQLTSFTEVLCVFSRR